MPRYNWLLIAIVLAGCGASSTGVTAVSPAAAPTRTASPLLDVFRNTSGLSGWTVTEAARIYNTEDLFDLVDGQAEAFFAYNFREVAVQRYQDAAGARIDAEVWELATPADAFGLFTASATGPVAVIGNDGDAEPGRRVSFWQARYTVHVSARQKLDDAILMSFANAISQALPKGGERPALVSRLPQTGLKERGFIFFRKELSIQDQLWLGGKNILGLGADTNGILARYDLGGQTARLVLVQYSDSGQANAGLQAIRSGKVANFIDARARDNLLVAVFGKVDPDTAGQLLEVTLKN